MLRSFGLVLFIFASQIVYCQDVPFEGKHLFGISLGANVRSHSIDLSNELITGANSTITRADSQSDFGFELGVLYHYQFHPLFGVRAQPNISFLKSQVDFELEGFLNEEFTRVDESVEIELPINLIFENVNKKTSPTFSLGGKMSYDLTTDSKVDRDPFSVFLEAGAGVAFRFSYFSFRPELIYSYGLSDQGTFVGVPAQSLEHHRFNHFAIRFSFYGV